MKKYLCIVLLMTGLCSYGQTVVKDVYVFPVKPGSKEWKQIESIKERVAALQIPKTVLREISTEGLLETCLEFPYLTDFMFFDDYQKGFDVLVGRFNGFGELLKRPDLTGVLLKKYKSLGGEAARLRSQSAVEQGKFTFRHFIVEFMLAQDAVCMNLSKEQEKQLFLLSAEHKRIKDTCSDIFGYINSVPVNLLYAKKAMNDGRFKFESVEHKNAVSGFIQSPVFIDREIIKHIEDYIDINYKND
jgi:hypothetical protein